MPFLSLSLSRLHFAPYQIEYEKCVRFSRNAHGNARRVCIIKNKHQKDCAVWTLCSRFYARVYLIENITYTNQNCGVFSLLAILIIRTLYEILYLYILYVFIVVICFIKHYAGIILYFF